MEALGGSQGFWHKKYKPVKMDQLKAGDFFAKTAGKRNEM
jgi:hypothetical protein